VLMRLKNGKLFVIGPHWFYSLLMLLVMLSAASAFFYLVMTRMNWFLRGFGVVLIALTFAAFGLCVLKDPGIVWKQLKHNYSSCDSDDSEDSLSSGSDREEMMRRPRDAMQADRQMGVVQTDGRHSAAFPFDSSIHDDDYEDDVDGAEVAHVYTRGDMLMDDLRFNAGPMAYGRLQRRPKRFVAHADTLCHVCNLVPPEGSFHCDECQVCIEGYDHHCPWTSKCIGKKNVMDFYGWITLSFITIIYMGISAGLTYKVHKTRANSLH